MQKLSARWAIRFQFALMGFGLGLWSVRIAEFKTAAGLSHAQLGLFLLLSPLALQFTMWHIPKITRRFGVKPMIVIGLAIIQAALLGLSTIPPKLGIAICFLMLGVGVVFTEIGANATAQKIDREDRPVMLSAHGWWSIGIMSGSFLGGWLGEIGMSFFRQELMMIPMILLASWFCYAPLPQPRPSSATQSHSFPTLAILPLCLMPLAALFIEGSIIDWGSVFLSEERNMSSIEIGILSSAFMGAMAISRLTGDWFRNYYSARFLIAASTMFMSLGVGMYAMVTSFWVIAIGAFVCGIGAGMIYPLVIVLANEGRDEEDASGIIASIAAVSFLAFLVSPPLIGFLAQSTSLSFTFVLLVPLGLSTYFWMWLTRPS